MFGSRFTRGKLFESAGELIELPLSRQRGRLMPCRLLTAKAWQRRSPVHGCDRLEEPQPLQYRWKAASGQRGFQATVSLQERCRAGWTHTRSSRELVGGVAAQWY